MMYMRKTNIKEYTVTVVGVIIASLMDKHEKEGNPSFRLSSLLVLYRIISLKSHYRLYSAVGMASFRLNQVKTCSHLF